MATMRAQDGSAVRAARRMLPYIFWSTVAAAYLAAILPQKEAPSFGWSDKVDHVAAFLTLAALARLTYVDAAAWRLFLALSGFGAFIELSQAVPFIGRDAEWADWVADAVAAAAGLAVAWPPALVWRRMLARHGRDLPPGGSRR